MIPSLQPPRVDDPSGHNAIIAIDFIREALGLPPSAHPHEIVVAARSTAKAVPVLRRLRSAISTFKGHGMPGFTDRAEAILVIEEADSVLSSTAH
jgi:hypothetical protein